VLELGTLLLQYLAGFDYDSDLKNNGWAEMDTRLILGVFDAAQGS
jgi:hypothetical protein